MKHIIGILEEALQEVLSETMLNEDQKERFSDVINDMQNELEEIYLDSDGEHDEE